MEVTEEMKAEFWKAAAWPGPNDLDVHRGLAVVLEIVERERAAERAAEYHRGYADRTAERSYNP